jgi:leader peptidase (prepilin peptidase)/N-methyltransferase
MEVGPLVDQLQHAIYLVFLFLFGAVFGSFGNVVIWRLPRAESLSQPGSRCPACEHPIRFRDNVPLVSWLLLLGRCRDCGAPISVRYPAVELLSGGLWLLAGARFGFSWQALAAVVLFYLMLLLGAIDLDTMRLPNVLVGVVAVAGLAGALVAQSTGIVLAPLTGPGGPGWLEQPLGAGLAGVVLGLGVMAAIGGGYMLVRGRSGLGIGDYKLLAAAGFFIGPYVLLALMLGSIFSLLVVVPMRWSTGENALSRRRFPFGPFLAAGIVAAAVAGPALWGSYLRMAMGG